MDAASTEHTPAEKREEKKETKYSSSSSVIHFNYQACVEKTI